MARWTHGRSLRRLATAASLAATGLWACYPGAITESEEADVVLTVFDEDHDFSTVSNYFMPDSVIREIGEDGASAPDDVVREFDEAILAEVEAQFSALGYQRVDDPLEGAPDGVVLISVNTTDEVAWIPGCWFCGWDWYPWGPDWGWSWGPGYEPGYPLGPGLGRRTVGTLVVTLLDPVAPGTTLPVWWAGAANGILSRDSDTDLARIQRAIGQMFVQSPYLDDGGAR